MGKKPVLLPARKVNEFPDIIELGNLRNKFSGKTLFRSKLYELTTGNLGLLDDIRNEWFFHELIAYARASLDINMVPALKKISGSASFSESTRQYAIEIEEIIEEKLNGMKNIPGRIAARDETDKTQYAQFLLAGTRFPQTTEILRLLRDKSPGLKRLALFLIGKFKMTDMLQEVCNCLSIKDIGEDAFSVLRDFGNMAPKELDKCYLATAGNIGTNKAVLRLLSLSKPSRDMSFLFERLWSSSRQIRETVLATLLDLDYKVGERERTRLKKGIFETYGTLAWIVTGLVSLQDNGNSLLEDELKKEYSRWKNFLLDLQILTYGTGVTYNPKTDPEGKDEISKAIPELAEIVFGVGSRNPDDELSERKTVEKKLKKLQRHFHCDVPEYGKLLEDIINCDYNLLGIWTKACAIRSIQTIDNDETAESIAALLFSPEELLREEATKLLARTGRDLYKSVSARLPFGSRKSTDRIISGEFDEHELVSEKVKFLSACFQGVDKDSLLTLAEKTEVVRNDQSGIYSQPYDSILWSFSKNNPDPELYITYDEERDLSRVIKDIRTSCFFCYVLPLRFLREFIFQYPENAFAIYRYIESKEA